MLKIRKTDIGKEEKILYKAYADCLAKVKSEAFYETFAKEKIKHSMQVVGAGNYILKNSPEFRNKTPDYIKLGKLVNLYHDIGRFKEIELLFLDAKSIHNHSFYSYEKLKELGYSDLCLLLPVKLHGLLAGSLEEDPEYANVNDEKLRKEIRELFFLVRDADKIANLHLIKYDQRVFNDLFYAGMTQEKAYDKISPKVLAAFEERREVLNSDRISFTDRLVQIVCFGFELHYKPSFDYVAKFGLFEHILGIMRRYNPDAEMQAYIEKSFREFMAGKRKKLAA